MITLKIKNFNIKINENENLNNWFSTNYELECKKVVNKKCFKKNCSGDFIEHDYYKRHLITINGNKIVVYIKRVKCSCCGITHALLPSFIIPYKQLNAYTTLDIIKAIHVENKSIYSLFLRYQYLGYKTLYNIRNIFNSYKEKINILYCTNEITIDHLSSIIIDYLDYFNCFFMQSHKQYKTYLI